MRRNVLAEVRRNVLSITCYIHTRVLAAGTAMDGETVYFLVKGIATTGTVLKRVGQRVRVEISDGSTSWVEVKALRHAVLVVHVSVWRRHKVCLVSRVSMAPRVLRGVIILHRQLAASSTVAQVGWSAQPKE